MNTMNKTLPALCATLWLIGLAAVAQANDWHQWRGPEQTGVSREKNLPETWDPETGENLVWKNNVGGMSSPIVMQGRVYTLSRAGEEPETGTLVAGTRTQESLVCIDADTGKPLWEYRETPTQTEVPFHRLGWSNVAGDPATGRVYALFVHCSLVCLDARDGKVIWKRQMTEEFGMISTFGGRTPSPAIDEDQLYIGGVAFGWGDHARASHRLFAFDKNTGELRWSSGTGGIPVDAPYNTPVVAVIGGQKLVVLGAGDGGVHAFKARTGQKVWSYKLSKRGLNASVVVQGDRVYATSSEENPDTGNMGRVVCLDGAQVQDGQPREVWRVDGIEAGFGTATIVEDRLYVIDNKGAVFALDAGTGKQLWRRSNGTIGKASLVYGDGKLYVPEANGRFSILQPGATSAKVLSKVELADKMGREYAIFGSVAIANGRVYLQTANNMYCIGPKTAQDSNEPIPPGPQEEPVAPGTAPAVVQVRPADLVIRPGEKAAFTAWGFDARGRSLGKIADVKWSIGQLAVPATQPSAQPTLIGNLKGEVDGSGTFTAGSAGHQGGAIVASIGDLEGSARVRVLPPLPWKFDFEQSPLDRPPLTWLGAGGKFAVREIDGGRALMKLTDFDLYARARTNFGAVEMSNYTVQADVRVGQKTSGERQMPDAGIINSRYVLVLLGNHQRAQIHVWSAELPRSLNVTVPYTWDPDKWYRLKLRVDQTPEKAIVRGKVWPVGSDEPEQWTVQLEDPVPNRNGNPGLYGNSLVTPYKSEIYYDNIEVSENK